MSLKTLLMVMSLNLAMLYGNQMNAQTAGDSTYHLSKSAQYIVSISALTAIGNTVELKSNLSAGLDAGLTINEIKEILVHLYAYCGFPRSLNAINGFMSVLAERKRHGLKDIDGKAAKKQSREEGKYERGRKVLEELTRSPQPKPAPGFGEFAPRIDAFLKEHLFADIFDSEALTFKQRELATISALSAMTGVESQLKSHLVMGVNTGITASELQDLVIIIDKVAGTRQANVLRKQLSIPFKSEAPDDLKIRIAEIELNEGSTEAYIEALREESQMSLQKEPGVISIFPLQNSTDPTKITIVEIYASEAAYQSHLTSTQFIKYKTSTASMIRSLKLIDMKSIDPEMIAVIFSKMK